VSKTEFYTMYAKERTTAKHGILKLLAILFVLLPFNGVQGAFLFPDMAIHAVHRSGGSSRYAIVVLKEEPYLTENGTGFVPDLMQALADKYRRLKNGTIEFQYEIVPVENWSDLMTRAGSVHSEIAFGLVCPYVLRHDERYADMHASIPAVHTSVKLITGTPLSSHHPHPSPQPQSSLSRIHGLVKMRGSPEDRLLEARPLAPHQIYHDVDTLASGLEYIRHHNNDYLVTDASVADCVVSHEIVHGLHSVCLTRKLSHSGHLFYGFFGKNNMLLKFLNDLLKSINEDGELQALSQRYFQTVRQCN